MYLYNDNNIMQFYYKHFHKENHHYSDLINSADHKTIMTEVVADMLNLTNKKLN